jgi:hypothetical protein
MNLISFSIMACPFTWYLWTLLLIVSHSVSL